MIELFQKAHNKWLQINTYIELVIHPDYKPCDLSATHSSISFAIALRNLANMLIHIKPLSVIQMLNQEHLISQIGLFAVQWTLIMKWLMCILIVILILLLVDIPTSSSIQSTSDQTLTIAPQTINVSPPPTLLLDYVILKYVCENIFVDLDKLVKSKNNFVHTEKYED